MDNVKSRIPGDEEQKIDINVYWKIFWRKKYYLIVPLVVSFGIVALGVRYLTPVYESYTVLTVEEQSILSRSMGRYISQVEERQRLQNQQYRAMIEARLKSRVFLELIIRDFDLQNRPEIRRAIAESGTGNQPISLDDRIMRYLVSILNEKIEIQNPVPGFFKISVFDTKPTTAYSLAKHIGEKYIDVTKQEQIQGIRQAGDFSDEQLAIYREKLETSEKELGRVKKEMMETDVGTNPVSAENAHYAEALKKSLDAQIGSSEIALKRVRERLRTIFGLVPSTDKISRDETAINYDNQINAQGDEQLLYELIGEPVTPEMLEAFDAIWQQLRQRISEIVAVEYGDFSQDLHPLITEYFFLRYQLDYYNFRKRKIQGYIDQYRTNMARRPVLDREFGQLNHEVETNRAIYQAFIESKTSAQISEAAQSTNLGMRISVIEEAEKPLTPIKPDKMLIIIISLVFGGVCGIGAILVTEYTDDSFRTIEEVQRHLKLPVVGTVPKTVSQFPWEKKKRGRMLLYWIVGLFLFVAVVSGSLYIYAQSLRRTGIGIVVREEGVERQR